MKHSARHAGWRALALAVIAASAARADEVKHEEIVIWGKQQSSQGAEAQPSSLLTKQDMQSINYSTTEDLVKYEPSLVIRKRFIGDSNGTLGMRGANMFQTARSMVFADGVPLHYLLQGRWSGAPRWTLIAASEIAQVEVLYGPFTAEYSGNAMGGVVLIESAIPRKREFHFDSSWFGQDFSAYGYDGFVQGYKAFASYGDRFGDTSLFLSYNHLGNHSQPQTFYSGGTAGSGGASAVSGALASFDERGIARLWFGDTGVVVSNTDNYKLKLGHDFGAWQALLNVALEDRTSDTGAPHSYLRDGAGKTLWSGTVVQDGQRFAVPAARLGVSELRRQSLSAGLRLRGPIGERAELEGNVSRFAVLRDKTLSSLANPADPTFTGRGEVMDFGDTGWMSAEIKLRIDDLLLPEISLVTGLRHDAYELNMDIYATNDYRTGTFANFSNRSGGESRIEAAFAQAEWSVTDTVIAGAGVRWEHFRGHDGYFSRDIATTPEFDLVAVPATSASAWSPKLSLSWEPSPAWRFAYAFGAAYRFPIVEELFSQYQAYNSLSIANPTLRPEHGKHHNLTVERTLERGVLRVNLYHERVQDTIESQSEQLPGGLTVRTFIPIDLIETQGVELIADFDGIGFDALDLRVNVVYTDATIRRNAADRSLEGKTYPRMPKWRTNLMATYHLRDNWDLGVTAQHASDSYGRLDNTDLQQEVYGAQDSYFFVGIKSTWRLPRGISLGIGVDNIGNDLAFVAHPWPGRTWYANLGYDF